MKVYMYSRDEAVRNHCEYAGDASVKMLKVLGGSLVCIFVAAFLSAKVPVLISESFHTYVFFVLPWLSIFVGVYFFWKDMKIKLGTRHVAFIKDEDTLWAVRAARILADEGTHPTEPIVSPSDAFGEWDKKLEEQNALQERFEEALIDAQKEIVMGMDFEKNFSFLFLGRGEIADDWGVADGWKEEGEWKNEEEWKDAMEGEKENKDKPTVSAIRLDDIQFIRETDQTEIYSYKNYKGKETKLEVAKAYPGLREEVLHTYPVHHAFPFPKEYKKHLKSYRKSMRVTFIVLSSIFWIPLLCWLILFIIDKIIFLSSQ